MKGHFYAGLQILIGLFLTLPLYLLSRLLMEINPSRLSMRIAQGPYYWAAVRKRRARGEPEWQEHDLSIGIPDPSTSAQVSGGGTTPSPPECDTCHNRIYGPVIAKRCIDCWSTLVNEKLEIK